MRHSSSVGVLKNIIVARARAKVTPLDGIHWLGGGGARLSSHLWGGGGGLTDGRVLSLTSFSSCLLNARHSQRSRFLFASYDWRLC